MGERGIAPFCSYVLDGGEWSVSCTVAVPKRKAYGTRLIKGLGRRQRKSGSFGQERDRQCR